MITGRQSLGAPTITQRLAEYVVGVRFEDVPDTVIETTKDRLVHHLGLALRVSGSESGRQATDLAVELGGNPRGCSIIGERRKANLLEAVFANSFLMHYKGLDDWHLPSGVHAGMITQPVAWAVGESTGTTGRELLTAIVVGYDVAIRLCNPVWTWTLDPPRGPNNVVAPVGAAATAARLLELSSEQTADALGHGGQAGMGLVEGNAYPWPINPLLARNGLMAAMLAKAGMPAPPAIIEGKHGVYRSCFFLDVPDSLGESLATLGHEFEIARTQTKQHPTSGANVIPMELTQRLVTEHSLTPERVASVVVTLPSERERREAVREAGLAGPGATTDGQLGSLRFWIGIIIADGRIDSARLAQRPDGGLLATLDKISLRFEAGLPLRYARVEVTTADRARYAADGATHTPPPLDRTHWLAENGRAVVSDQKLAQLAHLIEHLEDVVDIADVLNCLVPDGSK